MDRSVVKDVHNTQETRGAGRQKTREGEREIVGKRNQEKTVFPYPTLDFWYVRNNGQLARFFSTVQKPSISCLLSLRVEMAELGDVTPSKCLYFQRESLISLPPSLPRRPLLTPPGRLI